MSPRPSFHAAALGLLAAAVTLAACSDASDDTGSPPALTADLKLVHADAGVGPVSLEVGGTTVIQNLNYGHVSALTRVPGGTQHIVLRSGMMEVATLDAAISETALNSLLLSTTGVQVVDVVTPDTGAVAGDRANIRIVNVVGPNAEEPTVLDVKVTAAAAPDSVMTFGIGTQTASYGPLMYFDPGAFTFKFQPVGQATVLTEVTFTVDAGQTKDVVLERAADGTYSASVAIEQ